MAKITRKIQKIFGSTAGTNERGVIGSFAAASPTYSTDVDTMQSLAGYLVGWFNIAAGPTSPCIEDMNSLDYVLSYNIAYLQQAGIAEWYATTTYYIGSLVNDGTGIIYISQTNTNLGNTPTNSSSAWKRLGDPATSATIIADPAPTVNNTQTVYFVDTSAGAFSFSLPTLGTVKGVTFTIKDIGGLCSANPVTLVAGEPIEGGSTSYQCAADYGSWVLVSDGTNGWRIL